MKRATTTMRAMLSSIAQRYVLEWYVRKYFPSLQYFSINVQLASPLSAQAAVMA